MTNEEMLPLVSIIICNYNYERYIEAAIESALAVDWPRTEIIVVDDGSTDNSWDVISGFSSSTVKTLRFKNQGQVRSIEAAYSFSSGELVVFLDSDDLLLPNVFREAWQRYGVGVSKIQAKMRVIDGTGKATGDSYPKFPKSINSERISKWSKETGSYPTPPGSGNIYARWFLDQIFPVSDYTDRAMDSYCLSIAPLVGKVETINSSLSCYRVHDSNQAAMQTLDASRFSSQLRRTLWRNNYARTKSLLLGGDAPGNPIRNSLSTLLLRASSLRMTPEQHPIPNDTNLAIVHDLFSSLRFHQPYGARDTMAVVLWTTLVLFVPLRTARSLISWRYVPASRPSFLLGVIRR